MLIAEIKQNTAIFGFFKLSCHLKEETARGEMVATILFDDSSDSSSVLFNVNVDAAQYLK